MRRLLLLPAASCGPRLVSDSNVALGKIMPFAMVIGRMSETPGSILFGLGSGNSVSRVALMGLESYVNPNSPIALLGLRSSPVTQELWTASSAEWLRQAFLRVELHLELARPVWRSGPSRHRDLSLDLHLLWRNLGKVATWQAAAAQGVMVMAGFLGFIFSWLEEPGFMLIVALVVGPGTDPPGEAGRLMKKTLESTPCP